uniref:NADH-ubiquinone oxidoreductase chain 2 n=1 Tax=Betatropis formosana TaxID=130531 RepID=A0A451GIS2_9HEMI|nr:NADH dehydrogenase subunit 2 [Betatropis formosana]
MKMNFTKMMLMTITIISTMMILSSNNILFSWMMLETNLISFMPIMNKSNKISDQTMKYLIIQSTASSLMILSILLNSTTNNLITNSSTLLMTSMMMKMGMMPFHLWMPSMLQVMTWEVCFFFTTWQKVAPAMVFTQMISINSMTMILWINLILSPMAGLNQTSMKKIVAYSSMTNTPWMLMAAISSKMMFLYFMITYSALMVMITKTMLNMKIMFTNQLKMMNNEQKMMLTMTMLSMSGMPPMMGFFPKWMIIQSMMSNSIQTSIMMILSSMISTYIYIKMIYPSMMNFSMKKKNKMKSNMNLNQMIINIMGIPIMMILKMN